MAWYEYWNWARPARSELTIIDRLNTHLAGMTFDERVEALKAIVPEVCPKVHVSKNPPKGIPKIRKKGINTEGKEQP